MVMFDGKKKKDFLLKIFILYITCYSSKFSPSKSHKCVSARLLC